MTWNPTNTPEWIRRMEKRVSQLERRPSAQAVLAGNSGTAARSNTTVASVASGTTYNEIPFTGYDYLIGGITVSGNGLQLPYDGVYQVTVAVEYAVSSVGLRALRPFIDGVNPGTLVGDLRTPNASAITIVTWSGQMLLSGGSVISVYSYQNSGAAVNRTGAWLAINLIASTE